MPVPVRIGISVDFLIDMLVVFAVWGMSSVLDEELRSGKESESKLAGVVVAGTI